MIRRPLLALLLVPVVFASSCSLVGGGGGRQLTAFFPRAVAFFPGSHVKLMGMDVGRVSSVKVDGGRIRVRFHISRDIPLPADVNAAIVPLTLVGERNLVLFPAWRPGMRLLKGNAVIPPERTKIPVEPDDALKAFTNLIKSLDPAAIRKLAISGTAALKDKGPLINDALKQAGEITTLFAKQDDRLVAVAKSLHALATAVNAREAELGGLIHSFSSVTEVVARERQKIVSLLESLARLPGQGELLLGDIEKDLPGAVARLVELALVLDANVVSVRQTVKGLADAASGIVAAWDHNGALNLRGTASAYLAVVLQPLFDALGLGPVPCVGAAQGCAS